MSSKNVLDLAIVLGMLSTVLSLSDFLFRDDQKKAIQGKMDILTLKLAYAKPAHYFYTIFGKKVIRGILLVVGGILFILIYNNIRRQSDSDLLKTFYGLIIYVVIGYFGFRYYGMKLLKWMTKGNFLNFIGKYLVIVLGFILFYLPLYILKVGGEGFYFLLPIWVIISILLGLSGVIGVGWSILVFGFIVIMFRLIIYILEILVKISCFFLWRIVEYKKGKGAAAAITLLITALLGAIKVYYKL